MPSNLTETQVAAPKTKVSIVFRALNEEKWFADALSACMKQNAPNHEVEIILVDSGSTDRTIEIAESFGARVVHIKKSDFTFGRSLNYGCEAADGDYLIFISAHCIPASENWLANLVNPLEQGVCHYSYGRQIGHEVTQYSERQIFAQYFPDYDKLPQEGFFANNANSAISKALWEQYKFDEEATGLEDMVLAKQLVRDGLSVGYVGSAPVIHIHEETLEQTQRRYYREALTLREIMPNVQLHFWDFVKYTLAAIWNDSAHAVQERSFWRNIKGITLFRTMQYWGAYKGHNEVRTLSRAQKESYYYPKPATAKAHDTQAKRQGHLRLTD
jgi:glycosyltransferase involved in cell wall biosynthesis